MMKKIASVICTELHDARARLTSVLFEIPVVAALVLVLLLRVRVDLARLNLVLACARIDRHTVVCACKRVKIESNKRAAK